MKHISFSSLNWENTNYSGIKSHENNKDLKGDRIRYFNLSKGAKIPNHSHNGYEKIIIVKGKVKFSQFELSEGDILYTSKDEEHEAIALVDTIMLILNERL